MSDALHGMADFASHHIEGHAVAAREVGLDSYFKVPLVSEILPDLWMGGCRDGVRLGPDFTYVVSLYPWEKYTLSERTERLEVKLYDSADVPPAGQLHEIAAIVNQKRQRGRVLVHCQAGLNRSGLITTLALIAGGMPADAAIALLREKRCPLVLCNQAFDRWLRLDSQPINDSSAPAGTGRAA